MLVVSYASASGHSVVHIVAFSLMNRHQKYTVHFNFIERLGTNLTKFLLTRREDLPQGPSSGKPSDQTAGWTCEDLEVVTKLRKPDRLVKLQHLMIPEHVCRPQGAFELDSSPDDHEVLFRPPLGPCACHQYVAIAMSPSRLNEVLEEDLSEAPLLPTLKLFPEKPSSTELDHPQDHLPNSVPIHRHSVKPFLRHELRPSSSTQSEHSLDDMIEGPSSRKRKFAEDYLSDSDPSVSQASAPHFQDALVSSSDDSDQEWKERRINYFEKFAKEKRPLKHDYHHPIDKNIVEKHIRSFSQLLEYKQPDYSKRFILHKKLPFMLVYHDDGRPGRQSEVLQAGSNLKQTDWAWKFLYRTLVTSLCEKHSEDYKMELFKKDIYRSEQEELLWWLDKEIFAPYNSLPILGLSRYSFGSEGIDEALIQSNQEKLINYFSQAADKINTEPTVSELLKSYKDRPLKEPPETMKLPDYFSSEKNHESLVKLIEDPFRGYGLYYK